MARFLEGFVILFCGVDEAKRVKAKEAVLRCGGKCVEKFATSVTCGIVGRVGASGYKELLNAKIQLLTLKWLQDCVAKRSLVAMDGGHYRVGIFCGLNVVCTQLTIEERNHVQKVVEDNGGIFSDRFVGNTCTHLVAKQPDGEKYIAAKKCGTVRIVTPAWIDECIKLKCWLPELEFSVDYVAQQAKRAAQAAKAKAKQMLLAIPTVGATQTKEASFVEVLDVALCKDTNRQDLPGLSSVPAGKGNAFQNQLFWIHGYSAEMTDYLTMCVLAGGGLRSMVLCDAVTVALLGDRAHSREWTLVRRHPCGVMPANVVWVMEQLFPLSALLAIAKKTSALAVFVTERTVDGGSEPVSVEDLNDAYEAFVVDRKQQTGGTADGGTCDTNLAMDAAADRNTSRKRSLEDVLGAS